MKLSLLRLAVATALVVTMFTALTGTATAADAKTDPAALAWAWAVNNNCPCDSCKCTPADNCGCLSKIAAPYTAPAATPQVIGYNEVQVCENGRCKIVRVPVYASTPTPPTYAAPQAQKSEPVIVQANYTAAGAPCVSGNCASGPTTVQGSYSAPAAYTDTGASSGRTGFHPFQNLRERVQERRQNRGGFFGGRGGCGSCGG